MVNKLVYLSLVLGVLVSTANAEEPECILLHTGKYIKNARQVRFVDGIMGADTVVYTVRKWHFSSTKVVPASKVGYIIYRRYAIPYIAGKPQPQVTVSARRERRERPMVFGLSMAAGICVAAWQFKEWEDAANVVRRFDALGLRQYNSAKVFEEDRDRHFYFGVGALVGGLTIAGLSSKYEYIYHLPDGTVLCAVPSLPRPGLLLSWTW